MFLSSRTSVNSRVHRRVNASYSVEILHCYYKILSGDTIILQLLPPHQPIHDEACPSPPFGMGSIMGFYKSDEEMVSVGKGQRCRPILEAWLRHCIHLLHCLFLRSTFAANQLDIVTSRQILDHQTMVKVETGAKKSMIFTSQISISLNGCAHFRILQMQKVLSSFPRYVTPLRLVVCLHRATLLHSYSVFQKNTSD